jgi:hypothetical protein
VLAEHVAAMLQEMFVVLIPNARQRTFAQKVTKLQNTILMNVVHKFNAHCAQKKNVNWLFVQRQLSQLVPVMKIVRPLLLMLTVVVMIMYVNAILISARNSVILHVQKDILESMLMTVVVVQYHDVVSLIQQQPNQHSQPRLLQQKLSHAHIQHHVLKNQSVLTMKAENDLMVKAGPMKIHALSTPVMTSRIFELLSKYAHSQLHAQRE